MIYAAVIHRGRTPRYDRFYLARRGPTGDYFTLATFQNLEECRRVAEILNEELRLALQPPPSKHLPSKHLPSKPLPSNEKEGVI